MVSQYPVKILFFKITQVSAFLSHSFQCRYEYVIKSSVTFGVPFWVPPHPGLIYLFMVRESGMQKTTRLPGIKVLYKGDLRKNWPLLIAAVVLPAPLLSISLPFSPFRQLIPLVFGFDFLHFFHTNEQTHMFSSIPSFLPEEKITIILF